MSITIVTDSAAALPRALAEELGIVVVPMHMVMGGRDLRDGDRSLGELLGEDDVSTSGPSAGEFAAAIDAIDSSDASDASDGVLVCTIASSMSSTYQAAMSASGTADAPVRVLDTQTAAGAEALVVIAAAERARAGASLDEVERHARGVAARVRLIATVASLDRLVRSGRVPAVAGWAGRRLNVNPLFEFAGGRVRRLRPAFSRDAALARIVAHVTRSRPEAPAALHVVALHALAHEEAERLLADVSRDVAPTTKFVSEFSPVMVVHTGAGLVGLAWWWEASGPR